MRLCLPLALTLASVAGLTAADTPAVASTEPMVTWSVPDGARLIEHFNSSLYGTILNDPACAELRAKLITEMDKDAERLGFKVSDAIANFALADGRILGWTRDTEERPSPVVRFVLDLGSVSEPFFNYIASEGLKEVTVEGADAAFLPDDDGGDTPIIARFGTRIVGGNIANETVAPYDVPSHPSDWNLTVDGKRLYASLAAVMDEDDRAQLDAMRPALEGYLGNVTYEGRFIDAGLWERTHMSASCMWLDTVDKKQLDRFPNTTLGAMAVGLNGPELWTFVTGILAGVAKEQGTTVDELLAKADDELAKNGVPHSVESIVTHLTGTWSIALTPAAPFPALSFMMPRNEVIDDLVIAALAMSNVEAPAEGATAMIPLSGLPLPLNIARDARGWLLTSDSLFVNDWVSNAGGGFMSTKAALLASEKGGDGALIFGASDTQATFRTLTPFVAMGLGQMPFDQGVKKSISALLQKATAAAKTGYLVVRPEDEGITSEMQGVLTYSMNPVILAAIAIPNLLESRNAANEAAAAAILKSAIHPASIQFQSGAYADGNGDGVGEFGLIQEMCSDQNPAKLALSLLPQSWNDPDPILNGYHFRIYLPANDGTGTINRDDVDAVNAQISFVAYAWPESKKSGRRMFAINEFGQVYSAPYTGEEPAWNDLFGGEDALWGTEPTWDMYSR